MIMRYHRFNMAIIIPVSKDDYRLSLYAKLKTLNPSDSDSDFLEALRAVGDARLERGEFGELFFLIDLSISIS